VLSYLRRQVKSSWIKVILWDVVLSYIGTIFLVWGRGRGKGVSNVLAEVNGERIYQSEYQFAYRALQDLYRQIYGNQYTSELEESLHVRESALEGLVLEKIQVGMARSVGLDVTDAELAESIRSNRAFQSNGAFSEGRYQQVLRSRRMSPQEFEYHHRMDLLAFKLELLIRDSFKLSQQEIREAYIRGNEKRKVEYIHFSPDLYRESVELSDEEVSDYYEEHTETFREPERVRVRYMAFRRTDLESEVTVDQGEIEEYYERFSNEFAQDEAVRVRHIFLKVPADATPDVVEGIEAKGERVLKQLEDGVDFGVMAKNFSDDLATAEEGGDLPFFRRGEMGEAVEEVAFGLAAGETSGLVRTPRGFEIVQVVERREAGVQPLSAVEKRIRRTLVREGALALCEDLAEMISYKLTAENFEQIAEEEGLPIVDTDLFASDESVPEVLNSQDLVRVAFALGDDDVSDPVRDVDAFYLLKLLKRVPSHIPPLDDVRGQVGELLRDEKSAEMAAADATEHYRRIEAGLTLDDVAADIGLSVGQTGLFTRGAYVSLVGRVPEFSEAAFAHEVGETALVIAPGQSYIIRVAASKAIEESEFERDKAAFMAELLRERRDEFFSLWLERQQAGAEVVFSSELPF